MLEPNDFSDSSWTGPGMMEPLYHPFRSLPAASADDGGAGAGEEEEAAEALTAQGAEEGQEIAAQGQGEEGRQEEEAGGQETSPLAYLVDPPRERRPDG